MIKLESENKWTGIPSSRRIFGNFIESGIGRQITGIWSEMLQNRSFRPRSEYKYPMWQWIGMTKEFYNENAPFWHSGYEEDFWEPIGDAEFMRTYGSHMYKGKDALQVHNNIGKEAGIKQKRIHLHKGREYRFTIDACFEGEWTEAGLNGFGDIIHTDKKKIIQIVLGSQSTGIELSTNTCHYEGIFMAKETETVDFEIKFGWVGGIILSCVSLMPTDNIAGFKREVVEKLIEISPSVIRFPGGCFTSFFNWETAVGDRDTREAMESFYWGGIEENDVGIDEFMQLSDIVGFEPQICINMMTSSPFKAFQQVEYLNGSPETEMGRWRKLNGHEKPYHVKLIELDNEPARKWTCEQYAQKCVEFINEMNRQGSPFEYIIAAYSYGIENLERLLEITGKYISHVGFRDSSPEFMKKALPIVEHYNKKNNTKLKLANTEWPAPVSSIERFEDEDLIQDFHWRGEITNNYKKSYSTYLQNWNSALNTAKRTLDHISYGGEVFEISNFNNLCNTWGQNIINASKDKCWISCCGRVFKFLREHFSPCISTTVKTGDEGIYALLTSDINGKKRIFLVNMHSASVEVSLSGLGMNKAYLLFSDKRMNYEKESESYLFENACDLDGNSFWLNGLSVCCLE